MLSHIISRELDQNWDASRAGSGLTYCITMLVPYLLLFLRILLIFIFIKKTGDYIF